MKNMSRNRRPKFPTYMANKKNRGKTKNRKMAGQTVLVFLQVPFKENDDGMVLVLVMEMMMKLMMMVLLVVVIIMLLVVVLVMMMIMVVMVVVEVMMIMMMMMIMTMMVVVVVEKAVFTYLGQSFSNRVKQLPDTFCSLQQFQNYKKSSYYNNIIIP